MIATVTAVPFKTLPPNEKQIVGHLRGGSKNTQDLMALTKRGYHPVNRALNNLKTKNWVEEDYELSGGRTKFYKLRQPPTDGIEVIVTTGLDQESVSFNRYFESVAKQLFGGRQPKIFEDAEDYFKALAMVSASAAKEFTKPGTVTETELLNYRATIQRYVDALKEAYSIANQLLDNENLWHADTLATGVMRKTDRYLTPADVVKYARMIFSAFSEEDDEEISDVEDNNTEEETDSAD